VLGSLLCPLVLLHSQELLLHIEIGRSHTEVPMQVVVANALNHVNKQKNKCYNQKMVNKSLNQLLDTPAVSQDTILNIG
jgi:hypothetical protein